MIVGVVIKNVLKNNTFSDVIKNLPTFAKNNLYQMDNIRFKFHDVKITLSKVMEGQKAPPPPNFFTLKNLIRVQGLWNSNCLVKVEKYWKNKGIFAN